MKVVVTGVAGFIGSHLADRLIKDGHEVVGIDNLSFGQLRFVNKAVDFHKLDIRSREIYPLFKGAEVVVHLAAISEIPYCDENPVETCEVNVLGTVNVFEAGRQAGVKKTMYAETAAIYEGTKIRPTPETEFAPIKMYATHKACDNLLAKAYHNIYGVTTVGFRFLGGYGPRQDYVRPRPAVMSALMVKILKGKQPIMYENDDKKKRDFIYIDDIVNFIVQALTDNRVNNEVFNLGSGKNNSIQEVFDIIVKLSGQNIVPEIKPAPLGELQENLADITKATSLGWKPAVSLEEGLSRMWDFMKEQKL